MIKLELGHQYSREDVHSIFSAHTEFTRQSGSWGLHGIVKVPNRDKDYVFFVTYGQEQGGHEFDEGITNDGVLSWQTQPSQDLANKRVKSFIAHKDLENNIYLFLREKKRVPYSYYGRLGYLSHDETREKPVYFQWQILDWDSISNSEETVLHEEKAILPTRGKLTRTNEKPKPKRTGVNTQEFRAKKSPDFGQRDARNRKLGLRAEQIVLEYEKNKLTQVGRKDLAEKVVHTSVVEGDGAGYDIQSFNKLGEIMYIEVKATRGGIQSDFFISPNELRFSEHNEDHYFIYRLFELNISTGEAKFYVRQGDVSKYCELEPTAFRASPK